MSPIGIDSSFDVRCQRPPRFVLSVISDMIASIESGAGGGECSFGFV